MMPSLLTQMFISRVSYRSRKDLRVTNINIFMNPGLCVAGRCWLMCCVQWLQRRAVCIIRVLAERWRPVDVVLVPLLGLVIRRALLSYN